MLPIDCNNQPTTQSYRNCIPSHIRKSSESMSNFSTLNIPHGLYWIINPFQESDGVYAKLTGLKLKCPLNIEEVHPGLHRFYELLKPMVLGPSIDVVLFWFGSENQYSAIAVGPFGHVPNYQEEMMQFRQLASHLQVPEAWLHLIGVNTIAGHLQLS